MRHSCSRGLQAVAVVLLAAATAEAQLPAETFDQLRVLIEPGDTLAITDSTGGRMQGTLTRLSSSALVLNVSGAERQLLESDVKTIERRGPDSLRNGALIGLAVGGGLGAALVAAAVAGGEGQGLMATAALLYSGIGVGMGAGIDALVEGRRVIYAESGAPRATLSILPIVRRQHKGVMVSVSPSR